MTPTPPVNVAQARPSPLKWTVTGFGVALLAVALFGHELPSGARWIAGLGGVFLVLVAPAAARSMVSTVAVTEEGVTGAGFLAPIQIPWAEVVRVCDDPNGIDVQSATRSARINISSVTVRSSVGWIKQVGNFNNAGELVRFILAHVPKSAILELNHWMPT